MHYNPNGMVGRMADAIGVWPFVICAAAFTAGIIVLAFSN